jgi:hypothetical protein
LADVVAAIAREEGLTAEGKIDRRPDSVPYDYRTNAQVVALAPSSDTLRDLERVPGWAPLPLDPRVAAWTDDYSNILGAVLRKQFGW